jgi:hypothetical protein
MTTPQCCPAEYHEPQLLKEGLSEFNLISNAALSDEVPLSEAFIARMYIRRYRSIF